MSTDEYSVEVPHWVNTLQALASEANASCHFSERRRQVDAESFVSILVWGWLKQPDASLNQLAAFAASLGKHITAQALDERITVRAVVLLMQVWEAVLKRQPVTASFASARLEQFTKVYITDSTQVKLPPSLSSLFAGQGNSAQVKAQVCLEYLSGSLSAVNLESGRTPDQCCLLPVQMGEAGSLHLFDLGYFKQDHLAALHQQQAFYVTRYQSQTAVYDALTGERFTVLDYLQHATSQPCVELHVLLGARVQTPARLIAHRLPPETAAARRRRAKHKACHDGKTCTADYLRLQDWDIYLTNLPTAWSANDIAALYRLRWQIELVFRLWKSQLQLAHLGNWRIDRVLCQLYAHLIGCALTHALTARWRYRDTTEFSVVKLLQMLQITLIRFWHQPSARVFASLEDAFRRFGRKTKRKKTPSSLSAFID